MSASNREVAIVATAQTPWYPAFDGPEPVLIMRCVNDVLDQTGLERDALEFTIAGSCDYLSGAPFAFVSNIDGVGAWQVFWSITLPLLGPMILLALTFRILDAIRLFDTIFIMTGGGPGTQTYTASYYLYTVGFTQFHLSQATAGSWLFLIITAAVVTLLVRRLLRVEKV